MSQNTKITFGAKNNPAATTTNVSNTNYKFTSGKAGDNLGGSFTPYSQQPNPTTVNTDQAAGYGIQQIRSTSPINQRQTSTLVNTTTNNPQVVRQNVTQSFSSGQTFTPVTTSFENRNITNVSPQHTKITFGGKQIQNQYGVQQQQQISNTRYQTAKTTYVAPQVATTTTYVVPQVATKTYVAPQVATTYVVPPTPTYQTYQTVQTYQRPVEIAPVVSQIRSEPVREEVQIQKKVEQPVRVSRKESRVEAVPIRESKKEKKGGCPAWLWPLLGIIALLALILGLLFGLGVFGRIGGGANANAGAVNLQKENTTAVVTTPTVDNTKVTTINETKTETVVKANQTTTTPVTAPTILNTTTTPEIAQQSGQTQGYTVVDETVQVQSGNKTEVVAPTTSPVENKTTTTTTTAQTPITRPTVVVQQTAVQEQEYTIDPTAVAPTPVATTTTSYYTTTTPITESTSTTSTSSANTTSYVSDSSVERNNYVSDSSASSVDSPYVVSGTTYPTRQGYGSNPDYVFDGSTVSPTSTSAQ